MNEVLDQIGKYATWVMFIAAALVLLRGSIYKGTITALESTVSAQTKQIEVLKDNDAEKTKQLEVLDTKVESLQRENAALILVRPSAEAIERLTKKLDNHHDESQSTLVKILGEVQKGRDSRT